MGEVYQRERGREREQEEKEREREKEKREREREKGQEKKKKTREKPRKESLKVDSISTRVTTRVKYLKKNKKQPPTRKHSILESFPLQFRRQFPSLDTATFHGEAAVKTRALASSRIMNNEPAMRRWLSPITSMATF